MLTERDDEKTARTLRIEEAEARANRAERLIKRGLLGWSIAGVLGVLIASGWIAHSYVGSKASAAEVQRISERQVRTDTRVEDLGSVLRAMQKVLWAMALRQGVSVPPIAEASCAPPPNPASK